MGFGLNQCSNNWLKPPSPDPELAVQCVSRVGLGIFYFSMKLLICCNWHSWWKRWVRFEFDCSKTQNNEGSMLSLWLLCSFSLSGKKEGWVIGLRGRPGRQTLKKTFPTICLTEKVRLWEQEKGLTKWAHTFFSSSPQSPANERSSGPGFLVSSPSNKVGYKYKYEIGNVQIQRGSVLPDGLGFESMF